MVEDKYIVILIIIFLLVTFYFYNCKKEEDFKNIYNQSRIENFETKKNSNSKFTNGILNYNVIYCNQLLPKNNNNLYINNNLPRFNNKKEKHDTKSCYLDNLDENVKLKKNGYIIIDLESNKLIKCLQIKGLKQFRIDYCLDDKDYELNKINKNKQINFKPVLYGKLDNVNKLHIFKLLLQNNKSLVCRYLKITNLNEDTDESKPIKLELYGDLNFKYNTIINSKFNNVKPDNLYNNKIKLTKNEINNMQNNKNIVDLKLNNNLKVSGVSFKTNIPKFKISLSHTETDKVMNFLPENDNHYFNGGVSGIKNTNIFLSKPQEITQLKLIPFLNENSKDDDYVIKDIKFLVLKNGKNNNDNILLEGFQDATIQNVTSGANLTSASILQDIKDIIELPEACEALKAQQKINQKEQMLKQKLLFQHKLSEQVKEINKLQKDIDKLHNNRKKDMEQLDKNALIRHLANRGHENNLIDKINTVTKNQQGLKVNLNILDDSQEGDKSVKLF